MVPLMFSIEGALSNLVNLYLCLSFTISTSEVGWGSCPRSSASDYVFVYCLRLEGGLVLEDRGTWQHWQLTVKVNFVLVLVVAGEDSNRCCPVCPVLCCTVP